MLRSMLNHVTIQGQVAQTRFRCWLEKHRNAIVVRFPGVMLVSTKIPTLGPPVEAARQEGDGSHSGAWLQGARSGRHRRELGTIDIAKMRSLTIWPTSQTLPYQPLRKALSAADLFAARKPRCRRDIPFLHSFQAPLA